MRLVTKATLGFVALWTVGNILQVFLICRPFAATYDVLVEGTCGNRVASYIAIGCFNIVTDVIILSLPIPMVWSLKTSTKVKIMLTGIFLVGLIVSVVGVLRIVALTTINMKPDLTGTVVYADYLSVMETNLAILCVGLPMLRTLRSRINTRRHGDQSKSSGTSESRLGGSKKFGDSRSRHMRLRDVGVTPVGPESFIMNTVYSPRDDDDDVVVEYNATASKGLAGSQTEVAPSAWHEHRQKMQGIIVKTKVETHWTKSDGNSR